MVRPKSASLVYEVLKQPPPMQKTLVGQFVAVVTVMPAAIAPVAAHGTGSAAPAAGLLTLPGLRATAEGRCAGGYVVTPNVDHVVLAEENDALVDAYAHASLSLVDGMPLLWWSRAMGHRLRDAYRAVKALGTGRVNS